MARKRAPNAEAARLSVLAASNDDAFGAHALALLASGDRLAREAALDALIERPAPDARDSLRALFLELDADGPKRDQAASLRARIVRILRALADVRDSDVALRATETRELLFGDDSTWQLRAHGLALLAATAPDLLPFAAAEHLGDRAHEGEPARTAFQLLAGAGHYVPIYQWLLSAEPADPMIAAVFETFIDAPREIVERYARMTLARAVEAGHEALTMTLCETIVRREFAACYDAIGEAMFMRLSDELYAYLAMLLAGTNRAPLLALLEDQLRRGRHPRLVVEALRVRPTAETNAVLRRWEDGD